MLEEDAGDKRKERFGSLRNNKNNDEKRHPGFITEAKLMLTHKDQDAIEDLEEKAKAIVKDITPIKARNHQQSVVMSEQRKSVVLKNEIEEENNNARRDLGPLEKRTMKSLC